jgi:NADPH:quinone reductase-like Zn-dependent oxidoreductase
VVPETNVLSKPSSLSFAEGACTGTAWLTAYRMLYTRSELRPGQTILVQRCVGRRPHRPDPERVEGGPPCVGHRSRRRKAGPGRVPGRGRRLRARRPTAGRGDATELQRIIHLQHKVTGSTMGTRSELSGLLTFCDETGLRPQIGAELPMEEAEKAFGMMLDCDTAGKIVLTR